MDFEVYKKYRAEFEDLLFKSMMLTEKIIMPKSDISEIVALQIEDGSIQYNLNESSRVMLAIKLTTINVLTFSRNYHE